jgi:fructokinase
VIFGAIEAGGTKFICCVGRENEEPLAIERIPTTTPGETLARVVQFFASHVPFASIGIASFGPLDLDAGRITKTPKAGWSGADLVTPLRQAFNVPVAIDTDVSGAGLAEAIYGAGRNLRSLVYITAGTGIGGGVIIDGAPLRAASHAEMGHIRVARHPDDASFAGVCPFHGDCVEGMASGPAIEKRGADWDIAGYYMAQLCVCVTLLIAPHVIVIGGGVANGTPLLAHTHAWTERLLAGYPAAAAPIVPPALGDRAGIVGALMLARQVSSRA